MARHSGLFVYACIVNAVMGLLGLWSSIQDGVFSNEWSALLALGTWSLGIYCLVKSTEHGFFSLPVGYLALLGLFHLGLIIPLSIGFPMELTNTWPLSSETAKAMGLCMAAFSSYSLTAALYGVRTGNRRQQGRAQSCKAAESAFSQRTFLLCGLGLGFLGIVMLAAGASSLSLFQVDYSESYALKMQKDPRLFATGFLFMLMGMVVSAVGATSRQIRWIAMGSGAVFAPLFLYGFRGHLIVYFMTLLLIWYRKDPRLAKRLAVAALIAIVALSPTVRLIRDSRDLSFMEALKKINPFDFVIEAGGSLRPLVETVREIDYYKNGYWYGSSYLTAFSRVFPNINLDWANDGSSNQITAPAAWITARVDPYAYAAGGGMGFSGIAEPYLNFGPMGVILFFALAGVLLMKAERVARISPYHSAVLMCAYAALLWTSRNDFTNFFRPAVWALVFVSGIAFVARRRYASSAKAAIGKSNSAGRLRSAGFEA